MQINHSEAVEAARREDREETAFQGHLDASNAELREEDIEEYGFRIRQALKNKDNKEAIRLINIFNDTYFRSVVSQVRTSLADFTDTKVEKDDPEKIKLWLQKTRQTAKFYLKNAEGSAVTLSG